MPSGLVVEASGQSTVQRSAMRYVVQRSVADIQVVQFAVERWVVILEVQEKFNRLKFLVGLLVG